MNTNQSGPGVTAPSTIDLVAAERRQVLIAYGEHYGKQLHTIVSYNPDLTYNEDVMAGVWLAKIRYGDPWKSMSSNQLISLVLI
mgnify:CR=1 FL=1